MILAWHWLAVAFLIKNNYICTQRERDSERERGREREREREGERERERIFAKRKSAYCHRHPCKYRLLKSVQ